MSSGSGYMIPYVSKCNPKSDVTSWFCRMFHNCVCIGVKREWWKLKCEGRHKFSRENKIECFANNDQNGEVLKYFALRIKPRFVSWCPVLHPSSVLYTLATLGSDLSSLYPLPYTWSNFSLRLFSFSIHHRLFFQKTFHDFHPQPSILGEVQSFMSW